MFMTVLEDKYKHEPEVATDHRNDDNTGSGALYRSFYSSSG